MLPEGCSCWTGDLVLHRKMLHEVQGDASMSMQCLRLLHSSVIRCCCLHKPQHQHTPRHTRCPGSDLHSKVTVVSKFRSSLRAAFVKGIAICIGYVSHPTTTTPVCAVQVLEKQQLGAPDPNGGIVIREAGAAGAPAAEPAPVSARMQADADYARQLQAKLDAAEARGGPRRAPWPAGRGLGAQIFRRMKSLPLMRLVPLMPWWSTALRSWPTPFHSQTVPDGACCGEPRHSSWAGTGHVMLILLTSKQVVQTFTTKPGGTLRLCMVAPAHGGTSFEQCPW